MKVALFILGVVVLFQNSEIYCSCKNNDKHSFKTFYNSESYFSYDKVTFNFGCSLLDKWDVFESGKYIYNFNYNTTSFYHMLEYYPTQLGLLNEFGLNYLSVYYKFGPEFRIKKKYIYTGTWEFGIDNFPESICRGIINILMWFFHWIQLSINRKY